MADIFSIDAKQYLRNIPLSRIKKKQEKTVAEIIEVKNSILFEKLPLSCVSRIPDAAKVLIYIIIN